MNSEELKFTSKNYIHLLLNKPPSITYKHKM